MKNSESAGLSTALFEPLESRLLLSVATTALPVITSTVVDSGTPDTCSGVAPAGIVVSVTYDNSPLLSDNPPVAADDVVTVAEDSPATVVDVLANDSDPDADVLTVTGVGAASHGTVALVDGQVLYTPAKDYYGPDSFSYTISDSQAATATATVSVTVTAIDDAPVLTSGLTPLQYLERSGPQAIDPGLIITAGESPMLTGATIRISDNYRPGRDSLQFAPRDGIVGVFDAFAATLTLTGVASVAAYQAALRTVAYNNNNFDPVVVVRTISFTVNDGLADSNVATQTIAITAIDDAPTLKTIDSLHGAIPDLPFTITYDMLVTIEDAMDVDSSPLYFRIDTIRSGWLQKNGAPVTAGTLLGPGESLVWNSAPGTSGTIVTAFSVKAWDGQLASASAGVVPIMVAIPGDANFDGAVDVGDLAILGVGYGMRGQLSWAQADFTGDNVLDVGDLAVLGVHYGETTPLTWSPDPGAGTSLIWSPSPAIDQAVNRQLAGEARGQVWSTGTTRMLAWDGRRWNVAGAFTGVKGTQVWDSPDGVFLHTITADGNGILSKSTNGMTTFVPVLNLPGQTATLPRSLLSLGDGKYMYFDYISSAGRVIMANIRYSADAGNTWTQLFATGTAAIDHFHGGVYDADTGTLYVMAGDDSKSSVILVCNNIADLVANPEVWKERWGLSDAGRTTLDPAYVLNDNLVQATAGTGKIPADRDITYHTVDMYIENGYAYFAEDGASGAYNTTIWAWKINLTTKQRTGLGQIIGAGWTWRKLSNGVVVFGADSEVWKDVPSPVTFDLSSDVVSASSAVGFETGQACRFTAIGTLPTPLRDSSDGLQTVENGGIVYLRLLPGQTRKFTLHPTRADALAGTNTLDLYGSTAGSFTVYINTYRRGNDQYMRLYAISEDRTKVSCIVAFERGDAGVMPAYSQLMAPIAEIDGVVYLGNGRVTNPLDPAHDRLNISGEILWSVPAGSVAADQADMTALQDQADLFAAQAPTSAPLLADQPDVMALVDPKDVIVLVEPIDEQI